MRVLLIEDDAVLNDILVRRLQRAGHSVQLATNLADGAHWWRVQAFDAVLLDLNLPHAPHERSGLGNGLALLRTARARGDHTPVLVLTARDRTEERIAGLDAGADDYVGKPFDFDELEARMRAMTRRAHALDDRTAVGLLTLDRKARRFQLAGQPLDLPAREFAVLQALMTPAGRVVSKRELSENLSETDEVVGDNALEVFISRLRRKLAGSGAAIRTLRGLGYVVEEGT